MKWIIVEVFTDGWFPPNWAVDRRWKGPHLRISSWALLRRPLDHFWLTYFPCLMFSVLNTNSLIRQPLTDIFVLACLTKLNQLRTQRLVSSSCFALPALKSQLSSRFPGSVLDHCQDTRFISYNSSNFISAALRARFPLHLTKSTRNGSYKKNKKRMENCGENDFQKMMHRKAGKTFMIANSKVHKR